MAALTDDKLLLNDLIDVECTFYDRAEKLADPTTVTFTAVDPEGEITSYVFDTDDEVTRLSKGRFLLSIVGSKIGQWDFVGIGTGAVQKSATAGRYVYARPGDEEEE